MQDSVLNFSKKYRLESLTLPRVGALICQRLSCKIFLIQDKVVGTSAVRGTPPE
jgi:hypothetical protein